MNYSSPKTTENPPVNPLAGLPKLDPVDAMFALGSEFRWPIIQMLADGREMSITEGANVAGCTVVNFSKHLGVLLKGGVVECRQGADRRQTIFYIPAARRQVPGVIDYGFCKIDLRQT
jgi:predicted transcriptional regulator